MQELIIAKKNFSYASNLLFLKGIEVLEFVLIVTVQVVFIFNYSDNYIYLAILN